MNNVTKPLKEIILLTLLFLVLSAGVFVITNLIKDKVQQASRVKLYHQTIGIVWHSELKVSTTSLENRRTSNKYRPLLHYNFKVNNESFSGSFTKYYFSKELEKSNEIVHNYPKGSKITVFYDPLDPQKNLAIKKRISWKVLIGLSWGFLILACIDIFVLIRLIKIFKKESN